jgi:mycofactocin system glycosyltransferase
VNGLAPSVRVVLDASVRAYRAGTVLAGGTPARVMRLTSDGATTVRALLDGRPVGAAGRQLARRLVDAGLAHPRPPRDDGASVTVIVPARDRPRALARCLTAMEPGRPVIVVDDGSCDAAAVAEVARRQGARLLRCERSAGPAAARNAALAAATTELIAFVDSDCVPTPGWLGGLAGHFADPLVAAVAPRVAPIPNAGSRSPRERYCAARSPLDMGPRESRVVPLGRVPYVPTAALVVRRRALAHPFDERLRYGEDVDLVWRLHDAGWRIRYDPSSTVHHGEPQTWRAWLTRRWRYGTSAAALARRHPDRLRPVVAHPLPTAAVALVLCGRPRLGVAALALHVALIDRRLRRTGVPRSQVVAWSARAAGRTFLAWARAATALGAPALLVALRRPHARYAALALLVTAPAEEWARRRPPLDPLRWTAACIVDDAAYGLGVWWGCLRHRSVTPLLPALQWST